MNRPLWLIVICLAFLCFNCNGVLKKKEATQGFQGTWLYSTGSTSFSIQLYQDGSSLKGSHCFVMQRANRIDCVDDNKFSITGLVTGSNIASVTFHSYSSLTNGKASITKLSDSTIEWKVIQAAHGENYIPDSVVLKKEQRF